MDGKMLDDIEPPSSLLIHSDGESTMIALRIKRWLPAHTWIMIGRVLLLWSFIIGGLFISSWSASWMVNQQWVTPNFGGDILMTSWFVLSLTACGICLATWSRNAIRKFMQPLL